MKMNMTIAIAVLLIGLLAGCQGTGLLLSQPPLSVNTAPQAQSETDEPGDIDGPGDTEDADGDEASASAGPTDITADQAKAAAEAAHPGAKAVAVELEQEGGAAVYEVELDNGMDVLVDPANGNVLGVE